MPYPSLDSSMLMIIISFLYLCFCVGGRGLSTHTTPRPFHPCREKISGSWHIFVISYLCFWKGRGKRMEKSIFQKKNREKKQRYIFFLFPLLSFYFFWEEERNGKKHTCFFFSHSPARFLVISTAEKMFPFLLFQLNTHFFFFF